MTLDSTCIADTLWSRGIYGGGESLVSVGNEWESIKSLGNASYQIMMKVGLFFLHDLNYSKDSIQHVIYGRYEECGLLFVGEREIEMFMTKQGGEYHKAVFTEQNLLQKWLNRFNLDFLMLSVDEDEQLKLKKTCEACVASHRPYNLKDVLLMQLPFYSPPESTIFEVEKINNTQAVILILRECLNPSNTLRLGLEGLHSRQTFASTLYERLSPHALPAQLSELMGQLRV